MLTIANVLALVIGYLRPALLVGAAVVTGVCALDWLVRTRRINPFNPVARFFRSSVEPLMAPIERRIVRAGGVPSQAPWWMLAALIIGGIVLLSLLEFAHDQLVRASLAAGGGAGSVIGLVIFWTFGVLKLALLVRVIVSWLPVSPYKWYIRWAFVLTEPILRPLRAVIPPLGPVDVTPIAAYFILWLLEGFITRLL